MIVDIETKFELLDSVERLGYKHIELLDMTVVDIETRRQAHNNSYLPTVYLYSYRDATVVTKVGITQYLTAY